MELGKSHPERTSKLGGARVLLVEDEYYIADDVRRVLEEAGAKIVGPISTLASALNAVEGDNFDCAIIDLNLHEASAVPVVDRLVERGKPFAIATGYGGLALPDRLKDAPRIEKPFDPPALLAFITQMGCAKAS